VSSCVNQCKHEVGCSQEGHFAIGSDMLPGVTRSFDSFSAAALEVAWSRVWLGVHFLFDSTEGLALGDSLGNNIYHEIMRPAASGR
jgi:hypothetical protein